ncbi:sugar ABC transporter permease [Niabella soli DSM 19437]|uniref:Sugar ABC transporter permease n=2 Tax=Niabella TaxID=379899 RepID=W0EXK6_9BACT|nr:sugar ABC transporter permease [Niabella soli DSM 19437]
MKMERIKGGLSQYNTVLIFVLMLIVSGLITENFFTANNISNLIRQSAPIGLVSMGMLLVILTGGIDLSVGSVVAMIGVTFSLLSYVVYFPAAFLLSLLIGCGIGCLSGYLVAYRKIASFIVTLALMSMVRGGGYLLSKGAPISVGPYSAKILTLGTGSLLGVPVAAIVLMGVFMVLFVLLRYNIFGRLILAIGSNEEAVRLSGVAVKRTKFAVYVICAALTALAALLMVGRTGVGTPNIGVGLELDAIAAVVIGGAALAGGKGSVLNTLLGVFILSMIGNVMNLLDITSYLQQIIKGVIIIAAVLFQRN